LLEKQNDPIGTLAVSKAKPDSRHSVEVGQKVRIKAGLLKGAEDCLIGQRGALRFLVSVTLASKTVTADVPADDVEAI